jgi:hypothetical protein
LFHRKRGRDLLAAPDFAGAWRAAFDALYHTHRRCELLRECVDVGLRFTHGERQDNAFAVNQHVAVTALQKQRRASHFEDRLQA